MVVDPMSKPILYSIAITLQSIPVINIFAGFLF